MPQEKALEAGQNPVKPWPRNAWYVACTPDEIDGKALGRQICGERIVFFRGDGGKVAALDDFCPHRGAPLSLGTVQDGALVCPKMPRWIVGRFSVRMVRSRKRRQSETAGQLRL